MGLVAVTNTTPQSTHETTVESEWISTKIFASLAGISGEAARKAISRSFQGLQWRGMLLQSRLQGRSLQVYGPSLPEDLRDIWHERYRSSHPVPEPGKLTLPSPEHYSTKIADDYALRRWKLDLLAAALQFPKFSKERGDALKAIAAKETTKPNGKPWTPAISTLEAWLKIIEEQGDQGLQRKPRQESNPRVLISRAWDTACPLPVDKKTEIAAHMATHVKSLWAEGAPGWKRVNQLASVELLEQCRRAGWQDATLKNCEPGRPFVEKFREFALVALKENNAKRFFDTQTPRIQRHRNGYMPGDIVIGDVHPMDVVREIDGRMVHARLISWLDVATYDLFVTVVILPPGQGITQADIAASFVDMVQAWGLPKQLRLDNGKEYKWDAMIKGFQALAGLVSAFQAFHVSIMGKGEAAELIDGEQFTAISRARPYNAPAKQIEHVFAIIEYQFFSMMPGWIGGDRMNKRTQLVGQDPKAYRDDDEAFARDIGTCLDLYRNTVQKDGSSPNDKRRKAIAEGWRAVRVSRHDLIFAFSETRKVKVRTGGIAIEERGIKTWYRADITIPLIGKTIEIRYAKWAREALFYLDDDGKLHAIPQVDSYAQEDGQGAKEQSRLNGLKLAHVRQLEGQTKSLDLLVEAGRVNEEMPPAPRLPDGPLITTAGGEAIGKALAAMALPAPARLLPGQLRHPSEGHVIDMQPTCENGPKPTAIDFDPLKFALPAPEMQKPNPEAPEFDLFIALAKKHDEIGKDASC